jgi:Lrp/AsnC family leucine-responsive transcriptional regulator
MAKLDDIDLRILAALQENGRLSNIELAERVGLSHSSCSRRITRLERDGVILGYRALTDRQQMGLTVRAYCGVIREPDTGWEEVARELAELDGVVSVSAVSGDVDLMLEIVARDMQHYSTVVLRKLSKIKGVSATRSSFVLEEIKSLY